MTDASDSGRREFPAEDHLGAATPLPAAGRKPKRAGAGDGGGGTKKRRFPRPRAGLGLLLGLLAVVLLALVPVLGSTLEKTPRDKVGISYGGGPFEGAHFQKIVQPGSSLFFNGIFDDLYLYPADQQTYIVSKAKDEGESKPDVIVAPSKDRVQVQYQVAVYYKLNTDKLRAFHEQLGLRYSAYTSSGWTDFIQTTLRPQIENALQEETRRYDVTDIYGDAQLLIDIQEEVQSTLSQRLRLATGNDFFCSPGFEPGKECASPTFVIRKVEIPEQVANAYERDRKAKIEVQTRQNEAEGIEALAEALDKAGDDYVLLRAIESGTINFWVLPSDGNGVTLNAPGDPAGGGEGGGGGSDGAAAGAQGAGGTSGGN